jgi:hypothetical protein
MAITITPLDSYPLTDASVNFKPAFEISDTVQLTDTGNPIEMKVNFVIVDPYVRVFYTSSGGSPKTRVFVEYVPKVAWKPGNTYRIDLTFTGQSSSSTETYVFTIENDNVIDRDDRSLISDMTKKVIGSFPDYTRTAQDPFSFGSQLINPIALQFSDLRHRLAYHVNNKFLATFNLNTPTKLGRTVIGLSTIPSLESPSLLFDTKTIYGQNGLDLFRLYKIPNNTLDEILFGYVPDRISLSNITEYGDYSIDSFNLEAGITNLNTTLDTPRSLFLTISGGENVMSGVDNIGIYLTRVYILGLDKFGRKQRETVYFSHNQTIRTIKTWSYLTRVIVDTYATAGVLSIDTYPPANLPKEDPVTIAYSNLYRRSTRCFWDLEEDTSTSPHTWILKKRFRYIPDVIADGLTTKTEDSPGAFQASENLMTENESILRDSAGDPIQVVDFVVDRTFPFIYVLGTDNSGIQYIYAYHKFDEFNPARVKSTSARTFQSSLGIALSYEEELTLRGGVLDVRLGLNYLPQRKVLKHYWSIVLPDGTKKFIQVNGATGTISNSFTNCVIANDQPDKFFVAPESFLITLDETGVYRIELYTVYTDGVESIDTRYLLVRAKTPLAQYKLNQIALDPTPISDKDDYYTINSSKASYYTFNWSPGRHSIFAGTLSNAVVNLRSDITTASVSFVAGNTTLSATFGAASGNKIVATLTGFPAIGNWEDINIKVNYPNTLQDEFTIMRSGSFNRIFEGDRGELLLGTSTGRSYALNLHHDFALYDEADGELLSIEPYKRVIVLE